MPTPWTEARKARLEEHWTSSKLVAPLIALDLGGFEDCRDGGRSAVIGMAHRMGLPARAPRDPVDPAVIEARRVAKNDRDRRLRAEMRADRGIAPFVPPVKKPEVVRPTVAGPKIPFGDLRMFSRTEPNECRYIDPSNESAPFFACGTVTAPGASYCGHCLGIVYRCHTPGGLAPVRVAA